MLPDGFLFGEGVKSRIKEQLLHECKLHTIVRLPGGVFAPYTSTSSSMKNVSREVVLALPVPLPPLPEQSRIVARVAKLRSLCADLRQRLAQGQASQARLAEALG